MIYYIADLHLGHKNVIIHDNRPFASVDEMDQAIIKNWSKTVHPWDTVYIIGDMIWARQGAWDHYLKQMPGHKILIRGNHDVRRLSPISVRHFDEVVDYKEIMDRDRRVIMCHYPIPFHNHSFHSDTWMLYGHVHVSKEAQMMEDLTRRIVKDQQGPKGQLINAGCMMPYVNYKPRTLDELIEGWKIMYGKKRCSEV